MMRIFFLIISLCYLNYGFSIEISEKNRQSSFQVQVSKKKYAKYLLPDTHPLKVNLDKIFSFHVLANQDTFLKAGFDNNQPQAVSKVLVARHPLLPNHLVKAYLGNDTSNKGKKTGPEWLISRCKGAMEIKKLIGKYKIKNFTVPQKWIYVTPQNELVLLVTDENIVSSEETIDAWKNKVNKKVLDELYIILSQGLASCYVLANIPYTKRGIFSCVDTEDSTQKYKYDIVRSSLSPEMQKYWDKITQNKKN